MAWELILLEVSDGVATITLNRPEALNAFHGSMRQDLLAAIDEAASKARVVVITGAGKAFSSGGDVRAMASLRRDGRAPELARLIDQGKRVVKRLNALPIPSIAAVNGVAAGAGLGLALACDLRIASRNARLGATFSRIGLHPDWGVTYSLTRLAGPAVACDLIYTGRLLEADEARALGLVNAVVEPEELGERVREKAEELANAAPLSIRWAKDSIRRAEQSSLDEILDVEAAAQLACFATGDALEGITAFEEKRAPAFKGK